MINQIQDDTGAQITIEDDGTIYIGATDGEAAEAAAPGRQRDRQPDDARGRRALPRHGRQDDHLRRVRLAAAGQGRPAAHLQAPRARRRQAGRERRGRPVRRPEDPGRDRRDRRPRQALAGPGRRGRRRAPRLGDTESGDCRASDRSILPTRTEQKPGIDPHPAQHEGRRRHGDGRVRRTVLPGGLRVVTEAMPGVRSAALGVWVGVGSRDETPALSRCLALPRAPAVQGHARALGAGHLGRPRRGRRRVQRLHRQGVHLLLRAGARRRPAAGGRRALRHGHLVADHRATTSRPSAA